jgi:hypothetical protein
MVGVKEDATCSPWVTTDSNLANSYYVLGTAHAGLLRRLGRAAAGKKTKTAACATSPAHQQHASAESWEVRGETVTPDETLRRVVLHIVGSGNEDACVGIVCAINHAHSPATTAC